MRRFVIALATAALAGSGAVTAATMAVSPPGPVGAVHVARSMDNAGTSYVTITWASEGSASDGSVVCAQPGTIAPASPDDCESRIAVEPPGRSSGPVPIQLHRNYTFSVFSYKGTTPITYGEPVTVARHGVKVGIHSTCPSQVAGSVCKLTTVVTDNRTHAALGGRAVELWTSKVKKGSTWSRLARVTTNSSGQAKTKITLDRSRLYQWRYTASRTRELDSASAQLNIVVTH